MNETAAGTTTTEVVAMPFRSGALWRGAILYEAGSIVAEDPNHKLIQRYDEGASEPVVLTSTEGFITLGTLADGYVYYAQDERQLDVRLSGLLMRVPLSGGTPEVLRRTTQPTALHRVTVRDGSLHWVEDRRLLRMRLP